MQVQEITHFSLYFSVIKLYTMPQKITRVTIKNAYLTLLYKYLHK
jgi:hypothetical protein